jgi:hypothetical protein
MLGEDKNVGQKGRKPEANTPNAGGLPVRYFFRTRYGPGTNMTADATFAALLDRLRGGDEDAAQQIFHRFARRLILIVQLVCHAAQ